VSSFKVKLAAYFVLLALVPLAAAFWGFTAIAGRSEQRQADTRLQANLRASLAVYDDELDGAAREAERVAARPGVARALALRDRAAVRQALAGSPRLRVVAPKFVVGSTPARAATRSVAVIGPGGLIGSVVAAVPLDRRLLSRIASRAGFEHGDQLVLVERGRVVVGPAGTLAPRSGGAIVARLGGKRYRTLVSEKLSGTQAGAFAAITPQSKIDAASSRSRDRLLIALASALLLVGIAAWLEGRSIVRSVSRVVRASNAIAAGDLQRRVPVSGQDELATLARSFNAMAEQLSARVNELQAERARLQDAISLFGEALAATHDIDQLLRVVLDAEVEATGASGGMVIVDGRVAAEVGAFEGADRIEIPLRAGELNFGQLVLIADERFTDEQTLMAVSLAGHAVVALDNARLHGIVEHQALVDGLTGLANRRQAQTALESEVARAERFGGPLAFVLCDLDDFKNVNDHFGHLSGDDVLRELAVVLRESVRVVDTAARWGGEEFALLLPTTDSAGALRVAERARAALERRTILTQDGEPIRVTASFGIACYPEHRRAADLVAAADAALYEAKRRGKNRVETAPETARQG
jgi:two-component system cell cycle response regulator